jgi:hypothetical protein
MPLEESSEALERQKEDSVARNVAEQQHGRASEETLHAMSHSCLHHLRQDCRNFRPAHSDGTTRSISCGGVCSLQANLPHFQGRVKERQEHAAARAGGKDFQGQRRIDVCAR